VGAAGRTGVPRLSARGYGTYRAADEIGQADLTSLRAPRFGGPPKPWRRRKVRLYGLMGDWLTTAGMRPSGMSTSTRVPGATKSRWTYPSATGPHCGELAALVTPPMSRASEKILAPLAGTSCGCSGYQQVIAFGSPIRWMRIAHGKRYGIDTLNSIHSVPVCGCPKC